MAAATLKQSAHARCQELLTFVITAESSVFHGGRNKAHILLSCCPTGRPARMRDCNRHGDGALHPGRSRLCHQPLLLRFHPERNQVHLPQEVCVPAGPSTVSPLRRLCLCKCCFCPFVSLLTCQLTTGENLLSCSSFWYFKNQDFFFLSVSLSGLSQSLPLYFTRTYTLSLFLLWMLPSPPSLDVITAPSLFQS